MQHEGSQHAAELLLLRETALSLQRLDAETVLAIEEARDEQMTEPTERARRRNLENSRAEGHRRAAGRSDPHGQTRAREQLARDLADEGIPLGIGGEISQHAPNRLWRRGDGERVGDRWHCYLREAAPDQGSAAATSVHPAAMVLNAPGAQKK